MRRLHPSLWNATKRFDRPVLLPCNAVSELTCGTKQRESTHPTCKRVSVLTRSFIAPIYAPIILRDGAPAARRRREVGEPQDRAHVLGDPARYGEHACRSGEARPGAAEGSEGDVEEPIEERRSRADDLCHGAWDQQCT